MPKVGLFSALGELKKSAYKKFRQKKGRQNSRQKKSTPMERMILLLQLSNSEYFWSGCFFHQTKCLILSQFDGKTLFHRKPIDVMHSKLQVYFKYNCFL